MPKLQVNHTMPDFVYDTPFARGLRLSETVAGAPKTALIFLRYYGCLLCQYDIMQIAAHYDEISANGGQVLIVLQSDPDKLADNLGSPDALPFPIVCDPKQTLYRQFSIEAARDMEALGDEKVLAKVKEAVACGLKHGEYEGEELQLPAAFVVASDRTVLYAHYAVSGGDMPGIGEITQLLA